MSGQVSPSRGHLSPACPRCGRVIVPVGENPEVRVGLYSHNQDILDRAVCHDAIMGQGNVIPYADKECSRSTRILDLLHTVDGCDIDQLERCIGHGQIVGEFDPAEFR